LKHDGHTLVATFDSTRNETRISVGPMSLKSDTLHHISAQLIAEFSFAGRQIQGYPETVTLKVKTFGEEANFLRDSKDRSVEMRIGDVRVRLGDAEPMWNKDNLSMRELAVVVVQTKALTDLFSRVTDDKEGRISLGRGAFKLNPADVTSLRNFYDVSVGNSPPPSN